VVRVLLVGAVSAHIAESSVVFDVDEIDRGVLAVEDLGDFLESRRPIKILVWK
jgi:hypothetical protein